MSMDYPSSFKPEKDNERDISDELDESGSFKDELGIFSSLNRFERYLDRKIGLEAEPVERKLPEERHLARFLGWEFGLSLKESLLCCIFGTLLGSIATAYCTTFGAAMGLRQMSVSRYCFGWYPSKLITLVNVVQQVGWSAVGVITGGLALTAVADGNLSVAVGIVVIAAAVLVIGFLGLRVIFLYERYAWMVLFVVFMIIFGETAQYVDNKTPTKLSGTAFSGAILSFLSVTYGYSASWSPVASDYYVLFPANMSRVKIFFLSLIGLTIPTSIAMCAGAVTASALNTNPEWKHTYETAGVGMYLRDILYPLGFAKFLLVLLVLSSIGLNLMNTYSGTLSVQQISPILGKVPRFLWSLVFFGVVIALGLAGRKRLSAYLQNFLDVIGYWCTSYILIIFMEHVFVRKANFSNYDLTQWNNPKGLPHGIAAAITFLVGIVCWIMGMSETWYVGPLAALFGGEGGDVANEFTLAFTCIAYLPLRFVEMKIFGK
ncbi:hypothetical protein MNAN1_003479 [Malassezia nana]|uniref:Uncharacterized protein n=1 Tax=Malassezia nana TaxID=180528 RepID=A0AAF0EP28_9BASI|nr:hypothetical protein MNAN1_003479 [Malassezia nana]